MHAFSRILFEIKAGSTSPVLKDLLFKAYELVEVKFVSISDYEIWVRTTQTTLFD
jgi:hypothetical protein